MHFYIIYEYMTCKRWQSQCVYSTDNKTGLIQRAINALQSKLFLSNICVKINRVITTCGKFPLLVGGNFTPTFFTFADFDLFLNNTLNISSGISYSTANVPVHFQLALREDRRSLGGKRNGCPLSINKSWYQVELRIREKDSCDDSGQCGLYFPNHHSTREEPLLRIFTLLTITLC